MLKNQTSVQALYKRLLTLYPHTFRARMGASMVQTFADLYTEHQHQSMLRRLGFILWLFAETAIGICKEWAWLIKQSHMPQPRKTMEIKFLSILVDDQEKALRFYTEKLGFIKKSDMADGDSPLRWLTVVSPGGDDSVELELQAAHFPSAKAYQKDQFDAGYAFAILHTKDIQAEYTRLKNLGVVFRGEPEDTGPVITVKFEDTCGNLINLIQLKDA